jgi:hypothetical protein
LGSKIVWATGSDEIGTSITDRVEDISMTDRVRDGDEMQETDGGRVKEDKEQSKLGEDGRRTKSNVIQGERTGTRSLEWEPSTEGASGENRWIDSADTEYSVPEKLDSEPLDNHKGLSYGLFLSTNGSRTANGSSVVDFEDGLGRAEANEERENTREDAARRSEDARRFFCGVLWGDSIVFGALRRRLWVPEGFWNRVCLWGTTIPEDGSSLWRGVLDKGLTFFALATNLIFLRISDPEEPWESRCGEEGVGWIREVVGLEGAGARSRKVDGVAEWEFEKRDFIPRTAEGRRIGEKRDVRCVDGMESRELWLERRKRREETRRENTKM